MSTKDDGGPAFPQNDAAVNRINNEAGMSLRDYFAAQALAMFSNPGVLAALRDEARERQIAESVLFAAAVYEVADAMLAERSKP